MELILSENELLTNTSCSAAVDTYALGIGQNERIDLFFTVTSNATQFSYVDDSVSENNYILCAIESDSADMSGYTLVNRTYELFIPPSVLVEGFSVDVPMPPGSRIKRYVSARYVLSGDSPCVGIKCVLKTGLV